MFFIVVLGHTQCGAIVATLEEVRSMKSQSPNLRSIVARILPTVETLLTGCSLVDDADLVRQAVRANVGASADHQRHGSQILEQFIQGGRLLVVGAEYSLESGEVDFFDGVPADS